VVNDQSSGEKRGIESALRRFSVRCKAGIFADLKRCASRTVEKYKRKPQAPSSSLKACGARGMIKNRVGTNLVSSDVYETGRTLEDRFDGCFLSLHCVDCGM